MTEDRRQKTEDRRQKAADRAVVRPPRSVLRRPSSVVLLALCLSILALRVTYTESPTAQVLTTPGSLGDTVYSLTLSGLLIFAFVFWLLWGLFTGRLVYRFTGIEIGLAVFGVASMVSAWGASDKREAITQIVTLLGPLCAALLLVQILNHPAKVRVVLAVLVGLGIVSAYQCAEQFFISNAVTIEQYEKDPRMMLEPLGIETGTFQHFLFEHRLYSRGVRGFFTTSNSAASFALLASAAGAILLLCRLRGVKAGRVAPPYGWCAAGAMLLVLAGLFLTQSKGGILAFFAGLALCGLLTGIDRWLPAWKQRLLPVLIPLAVLLAAGTGYAMIRYGMAHGHLPGGNSMLVRWQYWVASAKMVADHPLTGIGPGNFSDYYTHYKPAAALESVADPHNFLLSLLTQYGPLGLIGFLAMVFLPLRRLTQPPGPASTIPDTDCLPSSRTLALAVLLGVCACLLLIRLVMLPLLAESSDVLLYEVLTAHVAPVAAFLIGFLLVASPLDQASGSRADFDGPTTILILGCAILAVLLHNLIDFALFEPGVWMAFWVVIACVAALRVQQRDGLRVAAPHGRPGRLLILGTAALLLGSYGFYVWRPACITAMALHQAQRAVSAGGYDAAHHRLEAAAEADPLSPVAANFNGRLYLQQWEQTRERQSALLEEAARCFSQAIERNPASYKNYENLALVYSRLGQPQKAYDWYLRAAGLYPGRERLWFELAQTAEKLGRAGLALCHYTKAVEIENSYRKQFRQMYPDREKIVSRLGDKEYQYAQKRIEELSK
ncbi:MAG: O-antigen ligase family protein [Planctomycetes bacterium]|nr:O-antigen ligase family protein [Planctomycetota bacterium]